MLKAKIDGDVGTAIIEAQGTYKDIAAEIAVMIHEIYRMIGEKTSKEGFRRDIERLVSGGKAFDAPDGAITDEDFED